MDDLVEKYSTLSRALFSAAADLEQHVDRLRRDAQSMLDRAEWYRTLDNRLGAAPHLVDLLKAQGCDDPIEEAATILETWPLSVEVHYRDFKEKVRKRSKRQRNRRICQLAREGMNNREIEKECKVSHRTIQRVLRDADLGCYAKPHPMPKRKLKPPSE